jgi:hypothetical protein
VKTWDYSGHVHTQLGCDYTWLGCKETEEEGKDIQICRQEEENGTNGRISNCASNPLIVREKRKDFFLVDNDGGFI